MRKLLFVGFCLLSRAAFGQATPRAAAPVTPAAPAAAAASERAATPAAATPAEPTLPQVTDDMLAPVPPATNVLSNWRDALRLLRQNSAVLRSVRAQEDITRAQAR